MSDSYYGGQANAERVADICAEAHTLIALGRAAAKRDAERQDCRTVCKYADGKPRWVYADGKMSHHCGR